MHGQDDAERDDENQQPDERYADDGIEGGFIEPEEFIQVNLDERVNDVNAEWQC